jgi:hypothetical protein
MLASGPRNRRAASGQLRMPRSSHGTLLGDPRGPTRHLVDRFDHMLGGITADG